MRPLTCRNVEELIVRDLDEGLDAADRARLEDHLQECSECCRLQEQFKHLFSAVRADVPEEPGEDFWRMYDVSLEAKLREKEVRRGTLFGWRVVGAFVAAGVILVAAALGVVNFRDTSPVDPFVSAAVMEDLTELYGPVPERYSPYGTGAAAENIVSKVASGATSYDDLETTWFEVEDERNHQFM